MKRLLIFALLGPLAGLLTGLLIVLPAISAVANDPTAFDFQQLRSLSALFPIAYVVGLLPALLVGLFDGILARRNVGLRVLWCALFGFAMSFVPLATSLSMGFLHGPLVLAFGLLGAVPGALCSWIAGTWVGNASSSCATRSDAS